MGTNTWVPLPPPTVSLKSTNDLLMPNPKQRLMPKLPPLTTVDTTAVDTDTVTDTTVLDTVDTMVDTTAVDTDTVVDTSTVNLNIKWLYNSVATRGLEPLPPPQMSSRVLDFVKIYEKTVKWDLRANYSMKNQNPNYGEFLSTMSTSNINQKIKTKNYFPPPYRIQKSLK